MKPFSYDDAAQEEVVKAIMTDDFPLGEEDCLFEAEYYEATPQIVAECEMIWTQTNQ